MGRSVSPKRTVKPARPPYVLDEQIGFILRQVWQRHATIFAREIGISRPLLHMHLQRLEAAGLIVGNLELSEDGKAMKYYEVADFDLHLSAAALAAAAETLAHTETKKERS